MNPLAVLRLQKHKNTKNGRPTAFFEKMAARLFFCFVELKRLSIFAIEFSQIKIQISHVYNYRSFEANQ